VKVLLKTGRIPTASKDMGQGQPAEGIAWFELVLHEGPPDETTWEGGGQTIAYWRQQFARLRNPHPWTIEAHGMEGVPPAVIPDDVLAGLPEDARISFLWNFVRTDRAAPTTPP
jgi:hypothetical protein